METITIFLALIKVALFVISFYMQKKLKALKNKSNKEKVISYSKFHSKIEIKVM